MSRTFWLVSENGRKTTHLTPEDREEFREDAIEITMYYVGEGEAIVISRGNRAVLVDGGEGTGTNRNDDLGRVLAARLTPGSLRAIVASHPHRDHTNFHHVLATEYADRFAAGARYFDNATPAADANWQRLQQWQPNLPFLREAVTDQPARDDEDRIQGLGAGIDAHLIRGTTDATSTKSQKYWSVFLFLRYRSAWMLFTGDAYKGYENRLLPRLEAISRRTHMLKVTHHGSSSGTSAQFVASLRPAISIASTDEDPSHRLEDDVRDRLSTTAIYATYDPNRPQHPEKDIVVRTDGWIWEENGFEGVLFEVSTREPVLL